MRAGHSYAEALSDINVWERDVLHREGWYAHVVEDDPTVPGGFNYHTHGVAGSWLHLDFQIIARIDKGTAHAIARDLVERVRAGESLQPGRVLHDVIRGLPVRLIRARECGRDVLRVVLPDPSGSIERERMSEPWCDQYALWE